MLLWLHYLHSKWSLNSQNSISQSLQGLFLCEHRLSVSHGYYLELIVELINTKKKKKTQQFFLKKIVESMRLSWHEEKND